MRTNPPDYLILTINDYNHPDVKALFNYYLINALNDELNVLERFFTSPKISDNFLCTTSDLISVYGFTMIDKIMKFVDEINQLDLELIKIKQLYYYAKSDDLNSLKEAHAIIFNDNHKTLHQELLTRYVHNPISDQIINWSTIRNISLNNPVSQYI